MSPRYKGDLTIKRIIVDGDLCLVLNDDYTPPSLLAPTVSTVLQPSSGARPSLPTAQPSPVANQAAARDTVTKPVGKESETEGESDDELMTDGKAESKAESFSLDCDHSQASLEEKVLALEGQLALARQNISALVAMAESNDEALCTLLGDTILRQLKGTGEN